MDAVLLRKRSGTIHYWKKYEVNSVTTYTWNRWNLVSTTIYYWNKYGTTTVTKYTPITSDYTSFPLFRSNDIVTCTYDNISIKDSGGEQYWTARVASSGYTDSISDNTLYCVYWDKDSYYGNPNYPGNISRLDSSSVGTYVNLPHDTFRPNTQHTYSFFRTTARAVTRDVGAKWQGTMYIYRYGDTTAKDPNTSYGQVSSTSSSAYPSNGASGSYWYESAGSSTSYSKGSTSYGTVSSTNSSAYPNGSYSGSYWYDGRTSSTSYSQGSYIEDIFSTDPDKYPANGISGSFWYVYQGQL